MITGAIGFITSPIGRYVAIGLAIVLAIAWVRKDAADKARADAQIECRAEVERRTQIEIDRQLSAIDDILADAERRAEASEVARLELEGKVNDLVAKLRSTGTSCRIPDELLRELRAIR